MWLGLGQLKFIVVEVRGLAEAADVKIKTFYDIEENGKYNLKRFVVSIHFLAKNQLINLQLYTYTILINAFVVGYAVSIFVVVIYNLVN